MPAKKLILWGLIIVVLIIPSFFSIISQSSSFNPQTVNSSSSILHSDNKLILNNLSVGISPKGIFYDPDNHYLYVANYASKTISVINVSTNQISKIINTTSNCWQFAYNPNNKYLYVSNDFANNITIVDTQTNSVIGNITTGLHKNDVLIFFDRYNNLLYVGSNQDNYLLAINTTTNLIISSIPIGKGAGNSAIGIDNNDFIYIADHISETINIIDGHTNRVVKTSIVGKAPGATLFDPYNGYVYITQQGYVFAPQHAVFVYDPKTNKVISRINVGNLPSALYYDSKYHAIYELNVQNSSIGVINDTNNQLIAFLKIGSAPTGIAISPNHSTIYITETGDNNVVYMDLPLFILTIQANQTNSTSSSISFESSPFILINLAVITIINRKHKIRH